MPGGFQFGISVSWGQESEMADTDEAVGQYMEKEAAYELAGGQGDDPVCTRFEVISGPEGNRMTIEGQKALVRDGYPMSVMAEIGEYVLGVAEWGLDACDPI